MNNFLEASLKMSVASEIKAMSVAKWLHVQMLLDPLEMQDLFAYLKSFTIFMTSKICTFEEINISQKHFLDLYRQYVEDIRSKDRIEKKKYHHVFSSSISVDAGSLFLLPLKEEKFLVKAMKPVIQLQPFFIKWDEVRSEFMTKVISDELIPFGIQLSYPQIYRDPKSLEMIDIYKDQTDKNTVLFKAIQKWARDYTRPTPFVIQDKKVNGSFRIGLNVLQWVIEHRALSQAGLNIRS